jgi:hypothetical protein
MTTELVGRELNAAVAAALGWTDIVCRPEFIPCGCPPGVRDGCRFLPDYSTDPAAMLEILNSPRWPQSWALVKRGDGWVVWDGRHDSDEPGWVATGDTLPLAVAKAALKLPEPADA